MTPGHLHAHQLLLYRDAAEFERGVTPFLTRALDEGRRTFMAVAPGKAGVLREALGRRMDAVTMADPLVFYRRHGPMFGELSRFVVGRMGEPPAAIVAEIPLVGLRPTGLDAHIRFESASNCLFERFGATCLCAYEAGALSGDALDAMHRVHPELLVRGAGRPSATFMSPQGFMGGLRRSAAFDRSEAQMRLVSAGDLGRLRVAVRDCAATAAPDPTELEDFLLAVTEIAANALLYGRDPRWVGVGLVDDEVICRIVDGGPGVGDALSPYLPPQLSGATGHGLWLAMTLTDVVEFVSDADGTEVVLRLPAHGP